MSWKTQVKRHPGLSLIGELLLTALIVGGLLWWVQTEQVSLPVASQWADARIVAGEAAAEDRDNLKTAFRDAYSWQDSAGNLSTYPISRDSYYFMRLARNIVETGSPCPASPSTASCHDMQVNPFNGRPMSSARSPHPWAIAIVYKALQATGAKPSILHAGRLHNRLMLIVCGLLAYLLVRQLSPGAPRISGLAAAVTLVLLPAVMQRSFGADNDVWILALLLGGTLAAAPFLKTVVTGAWHWFSLVITILATALLMVTWGGWLFLLIMLGSVAIIAFIERIRRRNIWNHRTVSVLGIVFFVCIVLLTLTAVLMPDWLTGENTAMQAAHSEPPPDAFASVTELVPIDFTRIVEGFGWPVLLAAVIGLAVALRRLWTRGRNNFQATLLLVLAWFVGAVILLLTLRYERFLILLAPPVAIFAGLGIGTLSAMLPRPALRPAIATGLSLALGASVVIHALTLVRDNRPQLNTAWVTVLKDLSRTTPDNAILLGWWNTGHWATYWARRMVAVDGASLRNPRIHAVGRLLASGNEGPLDTLVNPAACGQNTDCERPVYLLTSDELLSELGWMISGFWQTARASLVDQLAADIQPVDVPTDLLAAARNIDTPLERSLFAAPDARIWSTGWTTCLVASDNSYDCPLRVTSENGWLIERLIVPGGQINEARLVVRGHKPGEHILLVPSMLRMATPERLFDVTYDAPSNNPGILLDTVQQRAFLGTPAVLHSLVARLVLLDGRYDRDRFTQVISASTVDGHWVSAWRVLR